MGVRATTFPISLIRLWLTRGSHVTSCGGGAMSGL